MAGMGRFQARDLEKLRDELVRLENNTNEFLELCARELAARLLAKVVKRTPVGDYSKEITVVAKRDGKKHKKGEEYKKKVNPSGKQGGTLRRGWTEGQKVSSYAAYMPIHHFGNTYVIEIVNPVEYAAYVEYGHRTANHKGWVKGRFMMTISEQELKRIAPKVLENKIKKFLGGCLK